MANINEVIAGLKEGKSYIRRFGALKFAGFESLTPIGDGMCEHTFAGHDYGGVGGVYIEALNGECWPYDGWTEIEGNPNG